jgi:hypothetical protein
MGKHKQVVCEKCCRVMRSDNLERHMKQHENGKFEAESLSGSSFSAMYQCEHCKYESMYKYNMDRHLVAKHKQLKTENIQSKENHDNQCKEVEEAELIKESIEVYKIYLLLQRMKTKPNPY